MKTFLILALAALSSACVAAERPDWQKKYLPEGDGWKKFPQELVFNNGAEPESLDPAIVTGVLEGRLISALFEGLVNLDPETLEARPGVAASWDISADGLTYIFHMRDNAKWSDGSAVVADDFLRSWRRVLEPKTAAPYAYQLFPVSGAEDFHAGKVDFAQVGISTPDEHTVKVTLRSPCAYFLDLVAFQTLVPVPRGIEAFGERWVRPEHMISNGPYKLQSWEPRQSIVMVSNPEYWDRELCKLTKITALPYDDLETAYKRYQDGKLDWMPAIPQPKVDEIKRLPDYYVMPYLGTYFFRFNVEKPPFDDARVRKAFSLAIDRKDITDHVLKSGEEPTGAFCPPVSGYEPIKGLSFDRDQAKKLFAEAGYGDGGKKFPQVELLYNTSESHKQIAEAVVQHWRTVLGVSVSLRNSEWKTFLAALDQKDYQIGRSSWIGDYNDPNTFFDMFVTNGGNNQTGWSNKTYDELVKKSQLEIDPAKRLALFAEMERILVVDECPIAPIYRYVNKGLLRERVRGWFENIRDQHPFQYIWIEE
jgi:oligopeptide transport system substrate-binding protein